MRRLVPAVALVLMARVLVIGVLPAEAQTGVVGQVVVPRLVRFDGALTGPEGQALTGPALLQFGIYADQEDGVALWSEFQTVDLDSRGRFAVYLGQTAPEGLPLEVFGSGEARWLGVAMSGEPERPRVMLVSVPYALKAADADTLGGRTIADFVLANSREAGDSVGRSDGASGSDGLGTAAAEFGCAPPSVICETGGRVGIGTYAPASRLHVAGEMLYLQPSGSGPSQGLQLDTAGMANGSNAVFINAPGGWTGSYFKANLAGVEKFAFSENGNAWFSGRLGLGTNSPLRKLHLANGLVYLQPSSSSPNQGLQLDTAALPNGSNAVFINAPSGWTGNYFKANLDGVEQFAFLHNGNAWFNGNLGIGTASPSARLHVVGNATVSGDVTVSGNIAAKYQDVAEWVDAAEPIEAGTVVVIDAAGSNRVTAAERAYDSSVAGAVSPQPGLILGEPGAGKVLVAQSGRVRVKADAQYGAIRPGDLLVSSPTKGHVMRSAPIAVGDETIHRPGTLIGKALEALPEGRGEILVLLTLQ